LSTSPPYRSDSGQIVWYPVEGNRGLVTVDTERTQSLIGWVRDGGSQAATRHLAWREGNAFAAATLAAMDPAPIARASRLLLVVGTKASNQGMAWNEKRTSAVEAGKPGMLIEAPEGTLALRGITAKSVAATPLDGGGRALGEALPLTREGGEWRLRLSGASTPWFLIRVER
jgi:hypothetical protein